MVNPAKAYLSGGSKALVMNTALTSGKPAVFIHDDYQSGSQSNTSFETHAGKYRTLLAALYSFNMPSTQEIAAATLGKPMVLVSKIKE